MEPVSISGRTLPLASSSSHSFSPSISPQNEPLMVSNCDMFTPGNMRTQKTSTISPAARTMRCAVSTVCSCPTKSITISTRMPCSLTIC